MFKILLLTFALALSLTALAEDNECASTLDEVRQLVGNNGFPSDWREDSDKNTLDLKIRNGHGELVLTLTAPKGAWATANIQFCRDGRHYEARVRKIVWGSAAPGIVKGTDIKRMRIKMPYDSEMKVSVSIVSFVFNPAK